MGKDEEKTERATEPSREAVGVEEPSCAEAGAGKCGRGLVESSR